MSNVRSSVFLESLCGQAGCLCLWPPSGPAVLLISHSGTDCSQTPALHSHFLPQTPARFPFLLPGISLHSHFWVPDPAAFPFLAPRLRLHSHCGPTSILSEVQCSAHFSIRRPANAAFGCTQTTNCTSFLKTFKTIKHFCKTTTLRLLSSDED